MTTLYPAITPYNWQVDLAGTLTPGLDATVIAGTRSRKTLPWAMPESALGTESPHDLSGNLAAEPA